MRYFLSLLILLGFSVISLTGCGPKDDTPEPVEGLRFSPMTPYQEVYPGQIVTFKFMVKAPEPVTSFGIRFKLPGSPDYVALPEYPDITTTAEIYTSGFRNFEYSLPASGVPANAEYKFKFVAATASKAYEKEYTVKMLGTGLQQVRIYNPEALTFFTHSALDLVAGKGVSASSANQDLVALAPTITYPLRGLSFQALTGWTSGNGTKFKEITAAEYNTLLPGAYATRYNAITNEYTGASTIVSASANNGYALLALNKAYIAKVARGSGFVYVALTVKKAPLITFNTKGATPTVDLENEYLDLEIKK
jgi:hypothetical protein